LHLVELLPLLFVESALPVLRNAFLAFSLCQRGPDASFALSLSLVGGDRTE
jgi:hypothetical protein